jgi:imidazolonepropionase-like amidohydrolase
MRHLTRISLAVMCMIAQSAIAGGSADTIFFGGPIVTVNSKNQEAHALAIQDGKIVAVGAKDAVTKNGRLALPI